MEKRVNLDGDRPNEEVVAVDSHDCQHKNFRAYVHIRDRCNGDWRTHDLDSEGNVLRRFRIVNADGWTRRPEVFFVTGRARVVRLDDRRSGCARVRVLFDYAPANSTFDVQLGELSERFRGLELAVTDAQRVTTYRYDRALDRYVVYS